MTSRGNGSFEYRDSNCSYTAVRDGNGGYAIEPYSTSYSTSSSRDIRGRDRDGSGSSGNYHSVSGRSSYGVVSKEKQQEAGFKMALSKATYVQGMANATFQLAQATAQSTQAAESLARSRQKLLNKNRELELALANRSHQERARPTPQLPNDALLDMNANDTIVFGTREGFSNCLNELLDRDELFVGRYLKEKGVVEPLADKFANQQKSTNGVLLGVLDVLESKDLRENLLKYLSDQVKACGSTS